MKINNFVLYENSKQNSFEYGTKFIPKRTLNKSTDSMIVSTENHISGRNTYNICFKRNCNSKINSNSYSFNKDGLRKYIDFLIDFINDMSKNNEKSEKKFIVGNEDKITLSSLNKEYIKICSLNREEDSAKRIFFTLLKKELLIYINVLEDIYSGKEIVSSLGYEMGFLINPLSKHERDNLYLSVLYTLADSALDRKNKKAFSNISREIKKVLNS